MTRLGTIMAGESLGGRGFQLNNGSDPPWSWVSLAESSAKRLLIGGPAFQIIHRVQEGLFQVDAMHVRQHDY